MPIQAFRPERFRTYGMLMISNTHLTDCRGKFLFALCCHLKNILCFVHEPKWMKKGGWFQQITGSYMGNCTSSARGD